MPNPGIIAGLLGSIDTILGVRDQIGAAKQPCSLLARTWYTDSAHTTPDTQIGAGYALDTLTPLLPSPAIVNFSQDVRVREGGAVQAGDIILKYISKNSFTSAQLKGLPASANVERLYLVGGIVYQVINVVEDYVTFDVQLRQLSNQTRY